MILMISRERYGRGGSWSVSATAVPRISMPRGAHGSTVARSSTTNATVLPCWTFRNLFDEPSAPPPMTIVPVPGVDEEVGRVVLHLPVGRDGGQPPDALRGQVVEFRLGEDHARQHETPSPRDPIVDKNTRISRLPIP
nr:hypothetical protein [Micromonospora veneta]